ncbi:MAG TPA: D-2-hydroxyacid dehydrogenase [Methylomirabilota bacterium]|nr:D-2-hydroxyacid dehydrogenase [Methylomirabilota bacterium]
MRRRGPVTVLVHHPDPALAKAYAALVRTPRVGVSVAMSSTWEEAASAAADADVIFGWKFPPDLYARATRLAWLQAMGAGVDWALASTLPARVTLTRAPGIFGPWMREYVLGWCLWATQRTETYRAAQRARQWREETLPDRLAGKTMTIVGLGDIGRTIAGAVRPLGVRVLGVSRSGRAVREAHRVFRVSRLERALAEADFVVLVVPLTDATRGLIGAGALAAMKPSAWLLNIGRGGLVDEAALLTALRERRIGGAILDVFPTEPLPAEHPFWGLDNVVITPHISGPSTPAEIAPVFNANLARWMAGRPLRHVVDRTRGY